MNRILIRGATILPMTQPEDLIEGGDILIEGKTLKYVGVRNNWPTEELEVVSAEGKIALPGFVNTHAHLAMVLMRGYADDMNLQDWLTQKIWPLEARLKGRHVYIGSLLGAMELIAAGITTFADMYFFMEEVAQAVQKSGLRASLSQGMIVSGQPSAHLVLKKGLDFAISFQGAADGRISTMLAPHACYTCPPDFLRSVRKAAERERLGVHIHVSETQKEVQDCQNEHGKTPPQLLEELGLFEVPLLAAHCIILKPSDFPILKKAKGIAHCPVSNAKIAAGIAPVRDFLKAGINVSLATDGACSNNRLDLLQEIKTAAILAKVSTGDPLSVPAFQALQMATLGGARALGLEEKIGTLEKGKEADLVLLDLDRPHLTPCFDPYSHLAYAALPSDIDSVMVQGKWLLAGRKFLTLDWKEVKASTEETLRELVGK